MTMLLYSDVRHLPSILVLLLCLPTTTVIIQAHTAGQFLFLLFLNDLLSP